MCISLFWMMHCGIWNRCIVGFVRLVYCTVAVNVNVTRVYIYIYIYILCMRALAYVMCAYSEHNACAYARICIASQRIWFNKERIRTRLRLVDKAKRPHLRVSRVKIMDQLNDRKIQVFHCVHTGRQLFTRYTFDVGNNCWCVIFDASNNFWLVKQNARNGICDPFLT